MLKKIKQLTVIVVAIMSLTFPASCFADTTIIDESNISQGIIKVNYFTSYQAKYKLAIEKDGNKQYFDLNANESQAFPLIYDNGNYTINIMQNTTGNSYKSVYTHKLDAHIENVNAIYLSSNCTVNWNSEMATIKKANELTKNLSSDQEKFDAIYNYIISNYKYDYNKAATVQPGYIPDIEQIYNSKTGICYDYSVLLASMLRSQGIASKVVKGNSAMVDNSYHAWNEVLIDGQWIIVDTTVDAVYHASNAAISVAKSISQYSKTSEI